MKTLEQLMIEQSAAMMKLSAEHDIAKILPIPPDSVMLTSARSAPWVTYKVDKIADALTIFRSFNVVNMEDRKGIFRTVAPLSEQKDGAEHLGDYCIYMRVNQGEGFGPNVELVFYAQTSAGILRIRCDLKGLNHWRFTAKAIETRGRTDRLESRKFAPNAALNGYCDKVIKYSCGDYGPIQKTADIVYLLVADNGETCSEFTHAIAQLESIASEFAA